MVRTLMGVENDFAGALDDMGSNANGSKVLKGTAEFEITNLEVVVCWLDAIREDISVNVCSSHAHTISF